MITKEQFDTLHQYVDIWNNFLGGTLKVSYDIKIKLAPIYKSITKQLSINLNCDACVKDMIKTVYRAYEEYKQQQQNEEQQEQQPKPEPPKPVNSGTNKKSKTTNKR